MAEAPVVALPKTPYKDQDVQEIAQMVRQLEEATKKAKKSSFSVRKSRFNVEESRAGIQVDSWKMNDWDYKRRDLPTYARGLFTTRSQAGTPEIAVRGYNKFFNVNEVYETNWDNIEKCTKGPYELTLKENGCIIFVAGLEDDTLLVCSKHSTGARNDAELSHSVAGRTRLLEQLERIGKSERALARDLRERNATAVAELCDDSFEEHILAYGPDKAGLYLHGININVPEFMTYPSVLVQKFAEDWGFRQIDMLTMDDIHEVRKLLEGVAETGAYGGRDVEGFVIRCQRSPQPESTPYHDWFFKYKFEEPYLMYRQWRECTKALIAGRTPQFKKHKVITEEYLGFARKRIAANPKLAKLYNQNHGIIQLRDDFLHFKNMNGADAASFEELYGTGTKASDVDKDVILVPISTLGCGKTTIAVSLANLFGYGHVQNDNIMGTKRPPRFTRMVLEQLQTHPVVVADRNNAQKHERKQLLTDVKHQHLTARLVALNFVHDNVEAVRQVTTERVLARGDNHQTIHAASDPTKATSILNGFINRFERLDLSRAPDDGFDAVIDLDPTAGSRANVETVVKELNKLYPKLIPEVPSTEAIDAAVKAAIDEYNPELRHTLPDRGRKDNKQQQQKKQQEDKKTAKKKPLEYMAVQLPAKEITSLLDKTFAKQPPAVARFFKQLQQTRRVQPEFHVTLMHRASAKQNPELWERYTKLHAEAEAAAAAAAAAPPTADGKTPQLAEIDVQLERVVFDDRLMAIVVRLVDSSKDDAGSPTWTCVNKVAHITVGTRDNAVKPKESNDVLAQWLEKGCTEGNKIVEVGIEGRPLVEGIVRGVLSR